MKSWLWLDLHISSPSPRPHLITHVAQDGSTHFAQVIRELCHDFAPGFTVHHAHLTSLSGTVWWPRAFLGDKNCSNGKKQDPETPSNWKRKCCTANVLQVFFWENLVFLIHLKILKMVWEALQKKTFTRNMIVLAMKIQASQLVIGSKRSVCLARAPAKISVLHGWENGGLTPWIELDWIYFFMISVVNDKCWKRMFVCVSWR